MQNTGMVTDMVTDMGITKTPDVFLIEFISVNRRMSVHTSWRVFLYEAISYELFEIVSGLSMKGFFKSNLIVNYSNLYKASC